ncbi:ACP phosphodiesterase [Nocardioides albidus]|uniref:FMN dependent NADH:quinone oxidoreductase n=1 Tax=Nocardioides albidus TaxID=1517589 RepID=A0A5C4VL65_9ACTN|nr:NAD(P)H-dependent oxidoreductase [Nocardioides albidus]TNM36583.1 ACP phosphodiesterase [Nocardioides albidus]
MSTRLLHIVATPRGLASHTGRVSTALIEELHQQHDDLEVTTLDLFSADLPAVAGTNIKSKYALMTGQPLDEAARSSWEEIERTIEGFLAADLYVLSVPMWNFSIPYALKYYIDAIVQPGYLFGYDENGVPYGLVEGRRMVCVTSRGGDYSGPPMDAFDHMEGYLRAIFGFVGITDVQFFNVQPCDVTPELRNAAARKAIADVRAWVAAGAWAAREPVTLG